MSAKKAKPRAEALSFEEAMTEVESIVERIESGEMGLEEQIEQYAKGAALLARCREILEACEQRVETISGELEKGEKDGAG